MCSRHPRQTLRCFVVTRRQGEEIAITLYERWFDGNRLHCDELDARLTLASEHTGS